MIVPALLTDKEKDLKSMAQICSEFAQCVQIDIMDGEFVTSKSVGIPDLEDWKCPVRCEAHLMVMDPVVWIDTFKSVGAERIIYHFEINKDHRQIISKIREAGMSVGLAVNPSTKLEEFDSLVESVDSLLFMSVVPGFYGAKFIPDVLDKIKVFKTKHPDIQIGIDGGIKLDNAVLARKAGVDRICVGSAILKADDPKKAYQKIEDITDV